MPNHIRFLMKSFFAISFIFFSCAGCASYSKLPVIGQLSSFTMTNQDGKEFTYTPQMGKVGIASFIFTHCGGICPMTIQKVKGIGEEIDSKDFLMLSLTVDPKSDTPDVLKKYSEKMKAQDERWQYLTVDSLKLREILNKNFKVVMGEDENEPIHSDKIVLFDRQGRIRGYYGIEDQDITLLKNEIKALLKEKI